MRELFAEIWSSLRQNRLRTALTGLAVAWGIFLLIALLGAGNGLLNALLNNSESLDKSMLVVSSRTSKPYAGYESGRRIRMDLEDLSRLGQEPFAKNVGIVSPLVRKNLTMVYGDYYLSCRMSGVESAYRDILHIEMLKGRFINSRDNQEQRKSVVIGSSEAKHLHGREEGYEKMIGKNVRIGGFPYQIVGIFKSSEDDSQVNVYVPYSTAMTIYNMGNNIEQIAFSFEGIETVEESELFENSYRTSINLHHKAAPDDKRSVWIQNTLSSNESVNKAIRLIRISLWVLGLMSLVSGIVGVSNIMLISVKERTHEFGIRKAIGAKPGSILALIITESVCITAAFGYLGMVMGMLANKVMDKTMGGHGLDTDLFSVTLFVDPTVGLDVALEATMVLIIAGTVAGLIPAMKAAKVKPIEALRG